MKTANFIATTSTIPYGTAIEFVDIDHDGDLDAFQSINNLPSFYRNIGTASNPVFAGPFANPPGLPDDSVFADIDFDGDFDALRVDNNGNILFYGNTGTASSPAFAAPIANPFGLSNAGPSSPGSATVADIDHDGDLDFFAGGGSLFYKNIGTPSSPAFENPITNPWISESGKYPVFADIDTDGDLDFFFRTNRDNTLFTENVGTANSPSFGSMMDNGYG